MIEFFPPVYRIEWYVTIGGWKELIIIGAQMSPMEINIDNREDAGIFRMIITMFIREQ